MNDIVMKLREYAQNNKEDEGCSLMLEAADAIENLKKTPESAASKKVRKFFRKNPVFHAIMLNTWETSMRLIHENEHIPYQKRHVSFELTDEQTEIITGRYLGQNGTPAFEILGEVWVEGADIQFDSEKIDLYFKRNLPTIYKHGEWVKQDATAMYRIQDLWEDGIFTEDNAQLPEEFAYKADGYIVFFNSPCKNTGSLGWTWWANGKIGSTLSYEDAKRHVEETVRGQND